MRRYKEVVTNTSKTETLTSLDWSGCTGDDGGDEAEEEQIPFRPVETEEKFGQQPEAMIFFMSRGLRRALDIIS